MNGDRLLLLCASSCRAQKPSPFGCEDEAHLRRYTRNRIMHRQARELLLEGLRLLGQEHLARAGLQRTAAGKPVLPGASFSFSYTDRPYCLLSTGARALGLDCLALRSDFLPPPSWFREEALMRRLAQHPLQERPAGAKDATRSDTDPQAADSWQRCCAREVLRRFCVLEALVKACGSGLSRLGEVAIGENFRRSGTTVLANASYAWRVLPLPGFWLAMAVDEEHRHLLHRVEFHNLCQATSAARDARQAQRITLAGS